MYRKQWRNPQCWWCDTRTDAGLACHLCITHLWNTRNQAWFKIFWNQKNWLQYWYWNWILDSVPDTETLFHHTLEHRNPILSGIQMLKVQKMGRFYNLIVQIDKTPLLSRPPHVVNRHFFLRLFKPTLCRVQEITAILCWDFRKDKKVVPPSVRLQSYACFWYHVHDHEFIDFRIIKILKKY